MCCLLLPICTHTQSSHIHKNKERHIHIHIHTHIQNYLRLLCSAGSEWGWTTCILFLHAASRCCDTHIVVQSDKCSGTEFYIPHLVYFWYLSLLLLPLSLPPCSPRLLVFLLSSFLPSSPFPTLLPSLLSLSHVLSLSSVFLRVFFLLVFRNQPYQRTPIPNSAPPNGVLRRFTVQATGTYTLPTPTVPHTDTTSN